MWRVAGGRCCSCARPDVLSQGIIFKHSNSFVVFLFTHIHTQSCVISGDNLFLCSVSLCSVSLESHTWYFSHKQYLCSHTHTSCIISEGQVKGQVLIFTRLCLCTECRNFFCNQLPKTRPVRLGEADCVQTHTVCELNKSGKGSSGSWETLCTTEGGTSQSVRHLFLPHAACKTT